MSSRWNPFRSRSGSSPLRSLLRHCSVLVAGDVVANGISVISLGLTARALGPATFGMLVLIQTYAAIVDEIVNFQSWKALIKFGAGHVHAEDREPLKGVLKVGVLLDAGSALAAALLAVAGSFVLARWKGLDGDVTGMLVVTSLGLVCNVAGTPIAVLRLFERFRLFSVQKSVAAAVKLVGVVLAVALGGGLWSFVVVWLVAAVTGRLLLILFGWRTLRRSGVTGLLRARAERWKEVTRFAIWTNVITTVSLPIKQLDMALVGMLVSLESVGVYKLIKQIALLMTMVSDSVYQVIYPRLAGRIAAEDPHGAAAEARRTGLVLLGFTTSAAVLVALVGPSLITLLFGEAYSRDPLSLDTYMFLRAISCAFVVVHPLFLAMGFVRQELGILVFANLLYLGAAWVLGSAFGLIGIVLAYGLQFSAVLAPKLVILRGHLRRTAALAPGSGGAG